MVHRGAAAQLDVYDLPQEVLRQTRWLHLSSIGGRLEVLQTLFGLVSAGTVGLSWNPGKAELHLLATGQLPVESVSAHLIFMNAQEWDSIRSLQGALLNQTHQIIITDGAKGGYILPGDQEPVSYSSPALVSVDDTGAGDAFAAAYVAAYLQGFTPAQAAKWGVANAVSNIQVIGAKAGLLTRAEIERIA
jgi:sugar/nucleoside kinase (ribokinase family)